MAHQAPQTQHLCQRHLSPACSFHFPFPPPSEVRPSSTLKGGRQRRWQMGEGAYKNDTCLLSLQVCNQTACCHCTPHSASLASLSPSQQSSQRCHVYVPSHPSSQPCFSPQLLETLTFAFLWCFTRLYHSYCCSPSPPCSAWQILTSPLTPPLKPAPLPSLPSPLPCNGCLFSSTFHRLY